MLAAVLLPVDVPAETLTPPSGSSPAAAPSLVAQTPPGQTPPPGQTEAKPEAEAKADEESAGPSLADLGLKGKFIYKWYGFLSDRAKDGHFENEGILQLEWQRKLPEGHRFTLIGEMRDDDSGKVWGVNERIPDTRLHRSAIGVKEAVLALDFTPVRINLGKQRYTWGTADAFNPTDLLNPWDQMDPVDREKMGVWSASSTVEVAGVTGQVVIIPTHTPSREPLANSRWIRTSEDQVSAETVIASLGGGGPAAGSATIKPRRTVYTDPETIQYGARVKSTVKGWDVSLSYYDGYEPSPVLYNRGGVLEPVFMRIKAPGADFSTTWKKFEFHGEAVAKLEERRGRDDRFHAIVGLNYTLDELGLSWLEQIIFVAEHARETIIGTIKHREYEDYGGLSSAFRDAYVGRAIIKFDQDTEAAAGVVVDVVRRQNYYAQAKVTHKFAHWVQAELGLDFFAGDKDTFWGKWHNNDRFFMNVKLFF